MHELVAAEGPDASVAVEADNTASAGQPVSALVVAEAEDEFEQDLTAAFGPVSHWWTGELPGLGIQRLPLPE